MLNTKSTQTGLILFIFFSILFAPRAIQAQTTTSSVVRAKGTIPGDYPVRIVAPSIKLDSPIQEVGVDKTGAIDVPSGNTKNVGWYKYSTVPGNVGSAVLDAHIFAAFSNLKYLKENADIYVVMKSGQLFHFQVAKSIKYPLKNLSSSVLFTTDGVEHLNLITCAGALTKDGSTYDHRLIVYTNLVG